MICAPNVSAALLVLLCFTSMTFVRADEVCPEGATGIESLTRHLKGLVQPVRFDRGVEAFIVGEQDLGNCEHALLLELIDKKGKSTVQFWVFAKDIDPNFDFYLSDHSISHQMLRPKKQMFLKAAHPFDGYVDLGNAFSYLRDHKFSMTGNEDCYKDLVDIKHYLPVSGSAKKDLPKSPTVESSCFKNSTPPKNSDSSEPCEKTRHVDLSQSHRLSEYFLNAEAETGFPAECLAAIVNQESGFNPFAENIEEKQYCAKPKKGQICPSYKWSKGMVQMGVTKAEAYGLDWEYDLKEAEKALKECRYGKYRTDTCLDKLEEYCEERKRGVGKNAIYPVYCAKQSLVAMASYLSDILKTERKVHVRFSGKKNKPEIDQVIDLSYTLNFDRASKCRYAAAHYNRGERVDNSILEHYRQFGVAPDHYGNAWATQRKSDTPTANIGYRLLNGQYINRCYIWNIADLCGNEIPKDTLAGYFKRQFKGKDSDKKR